MINKLTITVTIPLSDDLFAATKLQTQVFEHAEKFKADLVKAKFPGMEFSLRVVRMRAEDAPPITRKKKEKVASAIVSPAQAQERMEVEQAVAERVNAPEASPSAADEPEIPEWMRRANASKPQD